MPDITLPMGTINYRDTGGTRPTFVFLHGVNMDASVWRHVVADLRARDGLNPRCVCPTLPLGSRRRAMDRAALVTHRGVAGLVADLLATLDLRDVILVMNDWGGAQLRRGATRLTGLPDREHQRLQGRERDDPPARGQLPAGAIRVTTVTVSPHRRRPPTTAEQGLLR